MGRKQQVYKEEVDQQQQSSGGDAEDQLVYTNFDDVFKVSKIARRNKEQLKNEKVIKCTECESKNKLDPLVKIRSFYSIPSLYTHLSKDHDIYKVPDEVKPVKESSTKVQRGRPPNQIQVKRNEELYDVDHLDEKQKILSYYENPYFVRVLQNLMFTEGFFSKNYDQILLGGKPLNFIMSLFTELSRRFNLHFPFHLFNSYGVQQMLVFLSELIIDEAFIIIFFAIIDYNCSQLLEYSGMLQDSDPRFKIVKSIIERETSNNQMHGEFRSYFTSLHDNLENLINSLQ